jgi:uncharacterized protein
LKLHLARIDSQNAFTGYGPGYVLVNGIRHEGSLIVLAERLVENWEVNQIEDLDEGRVNLLAGLGMEILLLGTGKTLRFPHPRLLAPLAAARTGVEIMDTQAACRTYNILLAEGRKVAAALIL